MYNGILTGVFASIEGRISQGAEVENSRVIFDGQGKGGSGGVQCCVLQ